MLCGADGGWVGRQEAIKSGASSLVRLSAAASFSASANTGVWNQIRVANAHAAASTGQCTPVVRVGGGMCGAAAVASKSDLWRHVVDPHVAGSSFIKCLLRRVWDDAASVDQLPHEHPDDYIWCRGNNLVSPTLCTSQVLNHTGVA